MPIAIQAFWDPILAQLGPFELGWHGILTALALFVGVLFAERLARGKLPDGMVTSVVPWAVVGAIIGARLFHVADHWSFYSAAPLSILAVWEGGIAVYGAFIGGVVAGVGYALLHGFPVRQLLDVAAPAMLLGQAIGRIGCFINGDATGAACGSPACALISVTYTNANDLLPDQLRGVPTHPYPLYEIAGCLLVLAVLWMIRPRLQQQPGTLFLAGMAGYAVVRFVLAIFRDENIVAFGLQQAQILSLATMLLAVGMLVWWQRRPAHPVVAEAAAPSPEGIETL
jgi:phosphatidylglycerol:prolipoprotein diacylglycerol transferase